MEEETIGMVAWNRFAKLLQGPGRHWMCGDVAMHDAPCSDLHQEEHIESSEPGGHYDQEIAGDDGLGVIANKRPPVLRRSPPVASSLRFGRPIGAHCAWRNIDAQLHRKLRGHARLAPSRILLCHLYDEFADVLRNSWPAEFLPWCLTFLALLTLRLDSLTTYNLRLKGVPSDAIVMTGPFPR